MTSRYDSAAKASRRLSGTSPAASNSIDCSPAASGPMPTSCHALGASAYALPPTFALTRHFSVAPSSPRRSLGYTAAPTSAGTFTTTLAGAFEMSTISGRAKTSCTTTFRPGCR